MLKTTIVFAGGGGSDDQDDDDNATKDDTHRDIARPTTYGVMTEVIQ